MASIKKSQRYAVAKAVLSNVNLFSSTVKEETLPHPLEIENDQSNYSSSRKICLKVPFIIILMFPIPTGA